MDIYIYVYTYSILTWLYLFHPFRGLQALSRSPGVSRGPSPSSRAASAASRGASGSRCRFLSAEVDGNSCGLRNDGEHQLPAIGKTIGGHGL